MVMIQSPDLEVEPTGESGGTCACCGNQSRTVWGLVRKLGPEAIAVASYFAQWTVGSSLADHPVNFDLVLGSWGDGTSADDRCAISFIYSEAENGPGVMVIDATDRPTAASGLAGSVLTRDEVVGTPLATAAFAIVDAVLLQDDRLPRDVG